MQRLGKHLTGQFLEDAVLEREFDIKINMAAATIAGPETPFIVELFQRTIEIIYICAALYGRSRVSLWTGIQST